MNYNLNEFRQLQNPGDPEVWLDSVDNYVKRSMSDKAVHALDKLQELQPHKHDKLRFKTLFNLGRINELKDSDIRLKHIEDRFELGLAYEICHELDKADAIWEEFYNMKQQPIWAVRRAIIHTWRGEFDKALDIVKPIMDVSDDPVAKIASWLVYLENTKPEDTSNVTRLMQLGGKQTNRILQLSCEYGISKIYEECGEYKKSFETRKHCMDNLHQLRPSDVDSYCRFIDDLMNECRDMPVASSEPTDSIIIAGTPRTGTTITTKTIQSHPMINTLAVNSSLNKVVLHGLNRLGRELHSRVDGLNEIELDYDEYRNASGVSQGMFIDKTPLNGLYVGLVLKHFPKSRVVIVERDRMDACYSYYKHLILVSRHAHSNDLPSVFKFYDKYQELMNMWKERDRVTTVRYEDLINDNHNTVTKLLSDVGLPYSEDCLNGGTFTELITSASTHQARQPLNSKSIGMWKNYKEELSAYTK